MKRVLRIALKEQRIQVRSGFLALWALEATIPMLVLAAAIAGWTGHKAGMVDWVRSTLESSILGATAGAASGWLTNVLDHVTLGRLGVLGVLSALFVCYQLYVAVLFDINEILEAGESERSWSMHVILFGVFIVWVALLLVGGMVATGWLYESGRWYLAPVSWMLTAGLLSSGPVLFGRNNPPARALFTGAAVGGVWLELLKFAFFIYSTSDLGQDSLMVVYRQLAFAPLLFMWMHLVWFSVLLAVVVSAMTLLVVAGLVSGYRPVVITTGSMGDTMPPG